MKKTLGIICVLAVALSAIGCAKKAEPVAAPVEVVPYKVAFVYIGVPRRPRLDPRARPSAASRLEAEFGAKVKTAYIENVPEGPDATRVIRQYAQDGYDMIFATSFGYMDPMAEVAAEFPKVKFEHCSGYKTSENMSTYFGRIYQARYLSGIVAGKMTKTNIIGYAGRLPDSRGRPRHQRVHRSAPARSTPRSRSASCGPTPGTTRSRSARPPWPCSTPAPTSSPSTRTRSSRRRRPRSAASSPSATIPTCASSSATPSSTSPVWNWGVYYIDTVRKAHGRHLEERPVLGRPVGRRRAPRRLQPPRSAGRPRPRRRPEGRRSSAEPGTCSPARSRTDGRRSSASTKAPRCRTSELLSFDWLVEGVVGKVQ
ncbi:MAG: BMP family ABC transporter substrate-binding protein [Desulfobacterales bacterium]|nr:BMP family ABC transporter substrate-binding protein [Desulfobacterales bacterium]